MDARYRMEDRASLRSPGARPVRAQADAPSPRAMRLERVRNELSAMVEGVLPVDCRLLFELVHDPLPMLKIADLAVVCIQSETGLYSLREISAVTNVVVTESEERLLDHIFNLLAVRAHKLAPFTTAFSIRLLVGETLGDIEHRLILSTLRVFNGDRCRTARSLGISEEDLRQKLKVLYSPLTRRCGHE